jgi:hypothetical protein
MHLIPLIGNDASYLCLGIRNLFSMMPKCTFPSFSWKLLLATKTSPPVVLCCVVLVTSHKPHNELYLALNEDADKD